MVKSLNALINVLDVIGKKKIVSFIDSLKQIIPDDNSLKDIIITNEMRDKIVKILTDAKVSTDLIIKVMTSKPNALDFIKDLQAQNITIELLTSIVDIIKNVKPSLTPIINTIVNVAIDTLVKDTSTTITKVKALNYSNELNSIRDALSNKNISYEESVEPVIQKLKDDVSKIIKDIGPTIQKILTDLKTDPSTFTNYIVQELSKKNYVSRSINNVRRLKKLSRNTDENDPLTLLLEDTMDDANLLDTEGGTSNSFRIFIILLSQSPKLAQLLKEFDPTLINLNLDEDSFLNYLNDYYTKYNTVTKEIKMLAEGTDIKKIPVFFDLFTDADKIKYDEINEEYKEAVLEKESIIKEREKNRAYIDLLKLAEAEAKATISFSEDWDFSNRDIEYDIEMFSESFKESLNSFIKKFGSDYENNIFLKNLSVSTSNLQEASEEAIEKTSSVNRDLLISREKISNLEDKINKEVVKIIENKLFQIYDNIQDNEISENINVNFEKENIEFISSSNILNLSINKKIVSSIDTSNTGIYIIKYKHIKSGKFIYRYIFVNKQPSLKIMIDEYFKYFFNLLLIWNIIYNSLESIGKLAKEGENNDSTELELIKNMKLLFTFASKLTDSTSISLLYLIYFILSFSTIKNFKSYLNKYLSEILGLNGLSDFTKKSDMKLNFYLPDGKYKKNTDGKESYFSVYNKIISGDDEAKELFSKTEIQKYVDKDGNTGGVFDIFNKEFKYTSFNTENYKVIFNDFEVIYKSIDEKITFEKVSPTKLEPGKYINENDNEDFFTLLNDYIILNNTYTYKYNSGYLPAFALKINDDFKFQLGDDNISQLQSLYHIVKEYIEFPIKLISAFTYKYPQSKIHNYIADFKFQLGDDIDTPMIMSFIQVGDKYINIHNKKVYTKYDAEAAAKAAADKAAAEKATADANAAADAKALAALKALAEQNNTNKLKRGDYEIIFNTWDEKQVNISTRDATFWDGEKSIIGTNTYFNYNPFLIAVSDVKNTTIGGITQNYETITIRSKDENSKNYFSKTFYYDNETKLYRTTTEDEEGVFVSNIKFREKETTEYTDAEGLVMKFITLPHTLFISDNINFATEQTVDFLTKSVDEGGGGLMYNIEIGENGKYKLDNTGYFKKI